MALSFERGSASEPKGHALLYFCDRADPSKLYATYIVVLPVALDVVKYMPPFLASQMGGVSARELSAFAFPPVPEQVEGRERLELLARVRDDDLLFGGWINPGEVTSLLATVNDLVQSYSQAYASYIESPAFNEKAAPPEAASGVAVNEVLYQLMGESDRLAELSRLIGRLRFAAEGSDRRQVQEVEEDINLLARYLPASYLIERLVAAAREPAQRSTSLAQLYMERCYCLARADSTRLKELEERIRAMEQGQAPPQTSI